MACSPGDDLRLPIAAALLELYGCDPPTSWIAELVGAMLPIEAAELAPQTRPRAVGAPRLKANGVEGSARALTLERDDVVDQREPIGRVGVGAAACERRTVRADDGSDDGKRRASGAKRPSEIIEALHLVAHGAHQLLRALDSASVRANGAARDERDELLLGETPGREKRFLGRESHPGSNRLEIGIAIREPLREKGHTDQELRAGVTPTLEIPSHGHEQRMDTTAEWTGRVMDTFGCRVRRFVRRR